jgi:hypothetical protein
MKITKRMKFLTLINILTSIIEAIFILFHSNKFLIFLNCLIIFEISSYLIVVFFKDISTYKRKLAEAQYMNKQLKIENDTLHEELMDIRHEMEELQDQFRLDDADEFRQLQAELEIAAKNCRILQFKLRKLERRNDSLESEKMLFQGKNVNFDI